MGNSTSTSADLPPDLQRLEEDFELLRELGRGAITSVYLARERESGRLVAIKAIRRRFLEDEEAVRRFAREAQVVGDLDHPNIVRMYGVRDAGERTLAIILEHVQGPTLRDALLEEQPFSVERVERVLVDVASALAYAHQRGLVHRDVKPENIFLDEETGRVLLSDFGIARSVDGDPHLTRAGMVVGTPTYMSPEQIDGRQLDGRSDVYSLGIVAWEMLAGRRPWEGESIYGVIYKHKHETLPSLAAIRPDVPRRIRAAIECALRKDHRIRCTAEEFLAQLGTREREARRAVAEEAADELTTLRLRHGVVAQALARGGRRRRIGAQLPLALLGITLVAGGLIAAERAWRDGSGMRIAAATHADSLLLCETPLEPHQRACLAAQMAEGDAETRRAYEALATAMGEPRASALHAEQREWVAERDRACRVHTAAAAGGRWALPVSRCLADRSARRSAELRARLVAFDER